MIWSPKIGMLVKLQYRKTLKPVTPDGCYGTIQIVGLGKGPINCLVLLNDGRRMVVPRGHLVEIYD